MSGIVERWQKSMLRGVGRPLCFLITLSAVLLATILRELAALAFGVTLIFPPFYLAVLFVTFFCGARWGALTVLLSILAADFVSISPALALSVPSKETLVNSIFFAIVALSIVWLAQLQRSMLGRIYKKRETMKMLMKELQHRSKNHLSVIQAVIIHSLRNHPETVEQISGRIKTISEADTVLTQSPEQKINLAELAALTLNPFEHAVKIDGPPVMLGPTLSQAFALVLHELCTNATKYGALRKGGGVVSVTWLVTGDELHLKWVETGGPPPEPQRVGGFGLIFVSNLLRNVDGKITSNFRQEGAVHSIVANLGFQDASRGPM